MNCYVCKNKSKDTTYHAFPKEPQLRIKWLEAFGFTETDIKNSMRICGDHFADTCFLNIQDENLKIRNILLKGSVPTIQLNYHYTRRKPDNDALHDTNASMAEVSSNIAKVNNSIKLTNKIILEGSKGVQNATVQCRELVGTSSAVPLSDNKTCTQLVSGTKICTKSSPVSDNSHPKAKRRMWRPAHVSQVDLEHGFDNPDLAKRHFQTAKAKIESLVKKVRILNQKVRRLTSKSEQQKSTIKLLKEESLESKRIKTNAEATTSETLKEVMSRKLEYRTKKFSPKLHEFAMNLHFCSPKAYKLVRTHLENVLPHATTIAKWYRVIDGNPRPIKRRNSGKALDQSENEITDNCTIDEMDIDENIDSDLEENHNGEITEEEQST